MKKFNQRNKILDRTEKAVEKEVLKSYTAALKEIRATLGKYYEKYDMTMAEMQKYNRLQALEKEILNNIKEVTNKNKKTLNKGLKNLYKTGYYQTGFILETEFQAKLSYSLLNPKVIENAIKNNITGLNWLERMGRNRDDTIFQIKQELSQGLIRGEGYQKMARRIKNRLGIDANKTLRVVRTEGHRVREQANHDSMEHASDKGLEIKKMWVSTLDDRTRDEHQELDGEVVDIDDYFSNGLEYPGDPAGLPSDIINCRCTMITQFDGYEATERRARDEGIIPYTDYESWFENRVKNSN